MHLTSLLEYEKLHYAGIKSYVSRMAQIFTLNKWKIEQDFLSGFYELS